jgi:pimeloyl-ACP methyl ester carboxylesterase
MNKHFSRLVRAVALAAIAAVTSCRAEPKREWYELGMMADPILDQVLLFYLGEAWDRMTDVNECLQTASRVQKKDPESWAREWRKTAERMNAEADKLLTQGHWESAGETYLRTASYYRATLHRHMHPGAPEVRDLAEREVACFIKSQQLLGAPMEVIEVPCQGARLTGYFYRSPAAVGRAPTLIVHQGRDAWAEDCKYYADEAVRRGYNCLLIDGPGNGQALRRHGLPFRPDWEAFVTPVVDSLCARTDVDPQAIMLMGLSMGGFLAPRAAAHEPRLRICIANPGVLDWNAVFAGKLKEYSPRLLSLYASNPGALDSVLGVAGRLSPFLMWGLTDTMWKHGASTPSEMLDKMKAYTNPDVARIKATTLVVDTEAEEFGQSKELFAALTCRKSYVMFTEAEAAPLHVQTGSLAVASQRIFDWIDDEIGRR